MSRKRPNSLHVEVEGKGGRTPATPGGALRDSFNINSPKIRGVPGGHSMAVDAGDDDVMTAASAARAAAAAIAREAGDAPLHSTPKLAPVAAAAGTPTASRGGGGAAAATPKAAAGRGRVEATSSTPARTGGVAMPSIGSPTAASRPSPAAAAGGGDDAPIPAALAALMHQTDKSGKQQRANPPVARSTPPTLAGAAGPPATSATNAGAAAMPVRRSGSSRRNVGAVASPPAPVAPAAAVRYTRPAATGSAYRTYGGTTSSSRRTGATGSGGATPGATGFASRVMGMLCCFSNASVAADAPDRAPPPPVLRAGSSRRALGGTPNTLAGSNGGELEPLRRGGRRALPPPPTGRINNVRRPASTWGEGPLMAPMLECDYNRRCLVLDLDETLVHSSFKWVPNADYVLPVEIEGTVHNVYVVKRPGCDEFLRRTGELYEVVVFTASLAKYADPLLDLLDVHNVIRARLFREACVYHENAFVKDLSLLGRDPNITIIVDNSPASYLFQPENALPCESFIDDMNDRELYSLLQFLEDIARVADVREALFQWVNGTWTGPAGVTMMPDSEEEADDPPPPVLTPGGDVETATPMAEPTGGTERVSVTAVHAAGVSDGSAAPGGAASIPVPTRPNGMQPSSAGSSKQSHSKPVVTSSAARDDTALLLPVASRGTASSAAATTTQDDVDVSVKTAAIAAPLSTTSTNMLPESQQALLAAVSHTSYASSVASPAVRDATETSNNNGATFNISVSVSVTAAQRGGTAGTPAATPVPTHTSSGSSVLVTPTGGTITNTSKRYSASTPLPLPVISITAVAQPGSGGAGGGGSAIMSEEDEPIAPEGVSGNNSEFEFSRVRRASAGAVAIVMHAPA